jgi:hypothetical protein
MERRTRQLLAFLWSWVVDTATWTWRQLLPFLVALVPFVAGWLVGSLVFAALWTWAAVAEGYTRGRQA